MPDSALDAFHFLRPWWLLGIPLAMWMYLKLRRVVSAATQWRKVIAPELLPHLLVGRTRHSRLRPYQVLTLLIVVMSFALAGPTWQREVTPFTEDLAPLVVVLELTESMLGIDQPPSRLGRAKQKVRDLLALRSGSRTAIIAYAGSAHIVLPLTDDAKLIELYLESLAPGIMPVPGDRPELAIAAAVELVSRDPVAGTILFMSDGIDGSHSQTFAEQLSVGNQQLMVLAFGTEAGGPLENDGTGDLAPPIDMPGLRAAASAGGGLALPATVDDRDVNELNRHVQRHLADTIESDEKLQWHDAGYYFVWPLALLSLFWFRRGWTVQWH